MGTNDKTETMELAITAGETLQTKFVEEVRRLLNTGALPDDYSRGVLFGVALENIADDYLRGDRKTYTYRNLKHF